MDEAWMSIDEVEVVAMKEDQKHRHIIEKAEKQGEEVIAEIIIIIIIHIAITIIIYLIIVNY